MNFKIIAPLTDQEADSIFKADLVSATPEMVKNYGGYFRKYSSMLNLPTEVLYSFALVESRGTHKNKSGFVHITGAEKSTGIMQISPNMFYEIYYKELKSGRISPEIKKEVSRFIPINFESKSTPMSASQSSFNIVANALQNVEFNILASGIVIRRLLEESANADMTMRMDKVIVKYNVGMYSKPTRSNEYKMGDTTALLKVVPDITKKYIKNIVGKNGALIYLVKNKIK